MRGLPRKEVYHSVGKMQLPASTYNKTRKRPGKSNKLTHFTYFMCWEDNGKDDYRENDILCRKKRIDFSLPEWG